MSNHESSWKAFLCLESPLERIPTKGRKAIYIYLAPPLPVKDAMWYFKQCACVPLSLGSTQLVRNCATNGRAISTRSRHWDMVNYFNIQHKKDSTRLFHFVMQFILQVTFLRAQKGFVGSSFLEVAVGVVFHGPANCTFVNVNFFHKVLFRESCWKPIKMTVLWYESHLIVVAWKPCSFNLNFLLPSRVKKDPVDPPA